MREMVADKAAFEARYQFVKAIGDGGQGMCVCVYICVCIF